MSSEEDGPIENYEEFFNEIFEDYQCLVSVSRLPEFMLKEEDLPDGEFKWGKSSGNILIKNASPKRPATGLGTIFAEQWMIFPEVIEPAVLEAINGDGNGKRIVQRCRFSLHTFTEVKANFMFASPEASETFRSRLESGDIERMVCEKIKDAGYEDELSVRYFNSAMTSDK